MVKCKDLSKQQLSSTDAQVSEVLPQACGSGEVGTLARYREMLRYCTVPAQLHGEAGNVSDKSPTQ
jgi:hypothetical protein